MAKKKTIKQNLIDLWWPFAWRYFATGIIWAVMTVLFSAISKIWLTSGAPFWISSGIEEIVESLIVVYWLLHKKKELKKYYQIWWSFLWRFCLVDLPFGVLFWYSKGLLSGPQPHPAYLFLFISLASTVLQYGLYYFVVTSACSKYKIANWRRFWTPKELRLVYKQYKQEWAKGRFLNGNKSFPPKPLAFKDWKKWGSIDAALKV